MRPTLYYKSYVLSSFLVLKMSIPDRVTNLLLAFSYTVCVDLAPFLICSFSPPPPLHLAISISLQHPQFSAHVPCILPPSCLSHSSPCGSSLRSFFLLSCTLVSATIMTKSRLRKKKQFPRFFSFTC